MGKIQNKAIATHDDIKNKTNTKNAYISFSYRYFENNEKFCQPSKEQAHAYLKTFLDRLKNLCEFTCYEFKTTKHKALRNHTHKWHETTEPNGFQNIPKSLVDCEPWQFCLSANEYGRIHGFFIDSTFYIVWLDVNHRLYQ